MTTAPIRSDWVGRVIDGRYPLRQWLGGSERSGVFLTELPGQPEQRAALKLIPADAADAQGKIAAWATAKTLSHPHLIRLLDSGRCEMDASGFVYVVTEYAEENLGEILPQRALTADEAGEMLGPVLDALAFLHAKGLAHGHLKPSNIMVVGDQVKLSSDGIVAAGAAPPAGDVWALGVTLVEALTQRPPVWDSLTGIDPVVPRLVPQPFFDIAQACLRLDPAQRCTIAEIGARLNGVPFGPKAPAPVAVGSPAPEPRKKHGMAWAAGIVVLLVAGGLAIRSCGEKSGSSEDEKAAASGSASPLQANPSAAKPSPIKGRAPGSEAAEQAERPEQPEQAEQPARSVSSSSPGSSDDSAVIQRVMPEILPAAQASIHGEFDVKVRLTVDSNGVVSDAAFDSEGPSRYFGKQALDASRKWRFKPAQMAGENVRSVWLLEYHFTESGVDIKPTQISP